MSVEKELRDKYEEEYHTGKCVKDFGGFSMGHWTDQDDRWSETVNNILELFYAYAGISKPADMLNVLELGAGCGSVLKFLKRYDINCVGLDISKFAIENRVEKDLNMVNACASSLPFESDSFDMVIAFDVLEHLPYDPHFKDSIKEIHRVLEPGGLLVGTVPLINRDFTRDILESEGVREHYIVQSYENWIKLISEEAEFSAYYLKDDSLLDFSKYYKEKGFPFNMSPLNQVIVLRKD